MKIKLRISSFGTVMYQILTVNLWKMEGPRMTPSTKT